MEALPYSALAVPENAGTFDVIPIWKPKLLAWCSTLWNLAATLPHMEPAEDHALEDIPVLRTTKALFTLCDGEDHPGNH